MNIPCLTDDLNSARADILEAKCHVKSLVTAKRALEGCE